MSEPGEDEHIVEVHKGSAGFGFNIKGTVQEGGVMQAINGKLYPPLQYISHADKSGAAYQGGLRQYDRLLEVNGVDVQGMKHGQVVDLVIQAGDHLRLRVLRVPEAEALRLQRLEEPDSAPTKYAPVGSHKLAVKSTQTVKGDDGKPFTVFDIFVDGAYSSSQRYSAFEALNKNLKNRFRWFDFPKFPGKKLNGLNKKTLNDFELEERMMQLDTYMQKVGVVGDIFKSDLLQSFLTNGLSRPPRGHPAPVSKQASTASTDAVKDAVKDPATVASASDEPTSIAATSTQEAPKKPSVSSVPASPAVSASSQPPKSAGQTATPTSTPTTTPTTVAPVFSQAPSIPEVSVLTPGQTVTVPLTSVGTSVAAVEEYVVNQSKLGPIASKFFGLFVAEGGDVTNPDPTKEAFERKLLPSQDVTKVKGSLILRRFLFSKAQEARADDDANAVSFLYILTVSDFKRGRLTPGEYADDLKQYRQTKNQVKFLETARQLPEYGTVTFRGCKADFPNPGSSVSVTLGLNGLTIVDEANADAEPTQVVFEKVTNYSRNGNEVAVSFTNESDSEVTMTLTTADAEFLDTCLQQIQVERAWTRAANAGTASKKKDVRSD